MAELELVVKMKRIRAGHKGSLKCILTEVKMLGSLRALRETWPTATDAEGKKETVCRDHGWTGGERNN